MPYLRTLLIGGLLAITTGCANGLNSVQKAELDSYEARGLAIQEKSPGTGAALGCCLEAALSTGVSMDLG
jgi:hypothetical protein